METLLSTRNLLPLLAFAVAGGAAAQSDRHEFYVDASAVFLSASTDLTAWPEGGFSKLRHTDDGLTGLRVFAEYHGRITPTLRAHVIADYVDDASPGVDITEAYLDWRPIPRSRNQQQWRFGMVYPPSSLENSERGWQSPFTYAYSAINTWLGEEIRPVGAEWSMRRRLEALGLAHELRVFAAGFYGNDPAAELLFYRGWSLHDRQTRLNDRLDIPPIPFTANPQRHEPFTETDHRPGIYGGLEWRYARRVLVQWARYDNRAEPYSFSEGQWGWRTAFNHLAVQVSLPAELGLVAQWMQGSTDWVIAAQPNGTLTPFSVLVRDDFESRFAMLTRKFGAAHRLAVRYDTFSTDRPGTVPELHSDDGHAWTVSYRFEPTERWTGGVEWLRIDSRRDLLPMFYALPPAHSEEQLRLQLSFRLGGSASR
jgi:hypothetical protein